MIASYSESYLREPYLRLRSEASPKTHRQELNHPKAILISVFQIVEKSSKSEPELGMIITHVVQIILRESIVSPASISLAIFSLQSEIKYRAHNTTHQKHCQTNSISNRVPRTLIRDEDIGSHNTPGIPKSNLHGGCN